MRFHLVCSMRSRFSVLGSFLRSFGVSREPLLEPGGTHWDLSWLTWRLLGCLGWPLGSLVGPIWASVGWICALLEALWRKSGHQLGDSVSLGGRFGFFWISGLRIKFFALSLDATGWVCGYWWSRFRSMAMRKYWSPATHKTKCTHVRILPVHVLIHYMTCALAATILTMAGSTRYDCNTYIRLHWSLWLMVYTCKNP